MEAVESNSRKAGQDASSDVDVSSAMHCAVVWRGCVERLARGTDSVAKLVNSTVDVQQHWTQYLQDLTPHVVHRGAKVMLEHRLQARLSWAALW